MLKKNKEPARVISITSGKGGVGKTHTTVNLGLALVKQGKKVLLLDADLGLANINILLGFQPKSTLHDILTTKAQINDIIVKHPSGLDIIPAASGIPEMTQLNEADRLFLIEALEHFGQNYDYMIVDTAAGIGDNVLYFNVAAEDIFVVIDPEPTSITDAYALIKVLSNNYGRKTFNIIANRSPLGSDGRNTYAQLSATTNKFLNVSLKFLGSISFDEAVASAVRSQQPYLQLFPSSKATRDMIKLAKTVSTETKSRSPSGGIQFFFKSLLECELRNS